MKKYINRFAVFTTLVLLSLSAICFLPGCASTYSSTPHLTSSGTTNGFDYVPSQSTSNFFREAGNIVNAVPSGTGIPYIDLAKTASEFLLSAALGGVTMFARLKSSISQHQSAADILASVVSSNNLSQQAINNTPPNLLATVQTHLDNNTVSK